MIDEVLAAALATTELIGRFKQIGIRAELKTGRGHPGFSLRLTLKVAELRKLGVPALQGSYAILVIPLEDAANVYVTLINHNPRSPK